MSLTTVLVWHSCINNSALCISEMAKQQIPIGHHQRLGIGVWLPNLPSATPPLRWYNRFEKQALIVWCYAVDVFFTFVIILSCFADVLRFLAVLFFRALRLGGLWQGVTGARRQLEVQVDTLTRPPGRPSSSNFHAFMQSCMHACMHLFIHSCIHSCCCLVFPQDLFPTSLLLQVACKGSAASWAAQNL